MELADAFQRHQTEIADRADRHLHRGIAEFIGRLDHAMQVVGAHDTTGSVRATPEAVDALLEIASLMLALATRLQMELDPTALRRRSAMLATESLLTIARGDPGARSWRGGERWLKPR